jgi:hypothetical protein
VKIIGTDLVMPFCLLPQEEKRELFNTESDELDARAEKRKERYFASELGQHCTLDIFYRFIAWAQVRVTVTPRHYALQCHTASFFTTVRCGDCRRA